VPVLYLLYSVGRYFTFERAFGADHFDPAVRMLPLVRAGIFRFTPNAMYVFGFLLLWIPALWWGSAAGLAAAIFNHAYIWVHYVATERPDLRRLYGPPDAA
jgi:protein-S-isoprenylcysteine O-methyltransferase Ste14